MSEHRTIGDILRSLGRISQDEVDRALAHQREHGGFFGEALVALGLLREEEVGWSLASQFDLPYTFPDAESVDPDAAALVTPEWALEHTALPITISDHRVVLLVDSPLNSTAVEELAAATGLDVELALASSAAIRQVVRDVFARAERPRGPFEPGTPVAFGELARMALESATPRFGLSVRDIGVVGWVVATGDAVRRYRLRAGWERELEAAVDPAPSERVRASGESEWGARLRVGDEALPVHVRAIATPEGRELLFMVRDSVHHGPEPPGLPIELLDELRLLAGRGSLAVAVRTHPPDLGRRTMARLPGLLLPRGHRSLHVAAGGEGSTPPGVFGLTLGEGEEISAARIERLAEFRFDAVTLDLGPAGDVAWDRARTLAPLAFLLLPDPEPRADDAHGAKPGLSSGRVPLGVDWVLELRAAEGDETEWSLEPATHPR